MKPYIGTKVILAEPQNNPKVKSGDPVQPGYKVQYEDGYVSWSPKAVFERCYREITEQERSMVVPPVIEIPPEKPPKSPGGLVYTGMKHRPVPFRNKVTEITKHSQLGAKEKKVSGFGKQGAGRIYQIVGNGEDLNFDLAGTNASDLELPVNILGHHNVRIEGFSMAMAVQKGNDVGDLPGGSGPKGKNIHPRLPGGAYCLKIDLTGQLFIGGIMIDARGQQCDYVLWRCTNDKFNFEDLEVTLQCVRFIGNTGEKLGVHADIIQNQGKNDPIRKPRRINVENSNFRCSHEGMVLHNWGEKRPLTLDLDGVDFNINDDHRVPGQRGAGIPVDGKNSITKLLTKDVNYTRTFGSYKGCIKRPKGFKTDASQSILELDSRYAKGNDQNGNKELHHYLSEKTEDGKVFVTPENIGTAYQAEHKFV